MVNQLLIDRFVNVHDDQSSLDRLVHGNVVNVKNADMRVFDRQEDEMMVFYYSGCFSDEITEITIHKGSLIVGGNRIDFQCSRYESKTLTSNDGDYYTERYNDLVALGLIER